MNVLPKKRVHKFTQYLMLSRNLSLQRSFFVLRIAFLRGKQTALQGLEVMRGFTSKAPSTYRSQSVSAPSRNPRLASLSGFLKISFNALLNPRFVWFSTALSIYGWFLFGIATEIFVLHRAIIQISPGNYAGVFISMALIWSGTIVFKKASTSLCAFVVKSLRMPIRWTKQRKTTRNVPSSETIAVQFEPLPQFQPRFSPEQKSEISDDHKPLKNRSTSEMKCAAPLTSSINVPEACLVCKELISCLSKLN